MSSTVIYIAACILSLLISSAIALVSWQRRGEPGAFPFSIVAASQASWTFGLILETLSPTLEGKIFWDNFQFLGWMLASTVVMIFAYEFTRMTKAVKWYWWILALAISFGTVVLAYTDPVHHLFRPTAKLIQEYDFTSLTYDFTPFMDGLSVLSYLTIIFSSAMLVGYLRRLPREQRPQVGYILAGLIFPLVGGILSFIPQFPSYLHDISPFTFGAGNALIAIGLMRYQLFEVSRYAKEQVIETMETSVVAIDTRGYISYLNPVAEKTLGINSAEIGRPAPRSIQNWFNLFNTAEVDLSSEHIVNLEQSGQNLAFVANLVQLTDNRRNHIGKALILNDITRRMQAEQTLSERTRLLEEQTQIIQENAEQLEESNQHAQSRAAQLQALAEVFHAIASINEIDILLPSITRVISNSFGFYHAGIFLMDDAREFAVFSAANSEGGLQMLKRGHKLKVGEGIVGNVVAAGIPRIALDTGADAIYVKNPDLPETRSEMALPLHAGNRVIGALDVQSTAPNAFNNEDIEVLATLADQVSIAIQNARLFEETKRSAAENQALLQQYARTQWSALIKSQNKIGYRYTGKVEELREKSKTIPSETTAEVPIVVHGQIIGTVTIHAASGKNFSEDELDIIRATTERAAIAAENARLLDESQQRAERERQVAEISAKIGASINVRNVLQTTAEELARAIPGAEVLVQFQSKKNEKSEAAQS